MIDLFETGANCKRCKLHETSIAYGVKSVCIKGVGSENATIMLVGEAPGAQEVVENKPFVGDAGKVLDGCLSSAGINRDEIFIDNVVRCRPPENATPTDGAIKACAGYLEEDLFKIKPKVVGLLGNVAIERILGKQFAKVTQYRGSVIWSDKYNCWCVPMFHPSYVMRNEHDASLKDMLIKDLKLAKQISLNGYQSKKSPVVYLTCDTFEKVDSALSVLRTKEAFAFDIETTSKDFLTGDIISITFSYQENTAVFIPFYRNRQKLFSEADECAVWDELKLIFAGSRTKIAHNENFEHLFFKKRGIEISLPVYDTLLMHHLLDENLNQKGDRELDTLAYRYTDMGGYKKPMDKYKADMLGAPFDMLCEYNCADSDCTLRLYNLFYKQLSNEHLLTLYQNVVMPEQPILTESQYRGVRVDVALLDQLSIKYRGIIDDLEQRLRMSPGIQEVEKTLVPKRKGEIPKFNFESTPQLRKLFFDVLKLNPVGITEKTKQPSTEERTLEILSQHNETAKLLLEFRKNSKLYSTFIERPKALLVGDRLHTSYYIPGTVTGRISSSAPNLQNVPADIRCIFIPDEGCVFVQIDYKQAEFRMWAFYSQDAQMMEDIRSGKDIHKIVAAVVYRISESEVTPEQRFVAKGVVFGLMYGRGIESLMLEFKCSEDTARNIIQTFFSRYPKAKQWLIDTKKQAKKNGYVKNLFGRIRRLPKIKGYDKEEIAEAERQAVNSPIQGGVADLVAMAMERIRKRLKEINSRAWQVLTVHDSIILNCPEEEVETVKPIVLEEANRELPGVKVPFTVDIKVGRNWSLEE